jgi:predicted small secreted protein
MFQGSFMKRIYLPPNRRRRRLALALPPSPTVGIRHNYLFTSNRRTADQFPGAPKGLFARTRNHMVFVGSVLVLNCEAVTVCSTIHGAGKLLESSI